MPTERGSFEHAPLEGRVRLGSGCDVSMLVAPAIGQALSARVPSLCGRARPDRFGTQTSEPNIKAHNQTDNNPQAVFGVGPKHDI